MHNMESRDLRQIKTDPEPHPRAQPLTEATDCTGAVLTNAKTSGPGNSHMCHVQVQGWAAAN
jgi:hypothetical protein